MLTTSPPGIAEKESESVCTLGVGSPHSGQFRPHTSTVQGAHSPNNSKIPAIHLMQCRRPRFDPWVGKMPWRRAWQPLQYSCLETPHGQRSLACCGPWFCKESDTTERLSTAQHSVCMSIPISQFIPPSLSPCYLPALSVCISLSALQISISK